MPSIQENLRHWNDLHGWPEEGDEWSKAWGSAEAEWKCGILPRIQPLLPADTVLEIGPGHGRWTQFLLPQCRQLYVVDLSPSCIEACRERFAGSPQIELIVNDGKTLPDVPSGSIDFAFSFDSLVHVELDVLQSYLHELARVLAPSGMAFVHHSNLAQYRDGALRWTERAQSLPGAFLKALSSRGYLVRSAWRGKTVSAPLFADACRRAGLACVSQETVNWENRRYMIDCFSLIARPHAAPPAPLVVRNDRLHEESARARTLWSAAARRRAASASK